MLSVPRWSGVPMLLLVYAYALPGMQQDVKVLRKDCFLLPS